MSVSGASDSKIDHEMPYEESGRERRTSRFQYLRWRRLEHVTDGHLRAQEVRMVAAYRSLDASLRALEEEVVGAERVLWARGLLLEPPRQIRSAL